MAPPQNTRWWLLVILALPNMISGHPHHDDALEPRTSSFPFSLPHDDNHDNLYANWPTYDQLPLNSSFPTRAAWGVWGDGDELGALNHITRSTVLAAASSEIRLGLTIPLNMPIDTPGPPPNPERKPLQHLFQPGQGYTDDVLVMNTQVSTQFDGLRHFPYSENASDPETYRFYNDLISSYDEVVGHAPTTVLGIQKAAEKGIAVRAVLLDWAGWMDEAQQEEFDAFSPRDITTEALDAVARWQGLGDKDGKWAKAGDMLVVRTGWMRQYRTLNQTERALLPLGDGFSVGMEAGDDMLRWLWEKKLSLVGADNPAFESLPMNKTISGEPRSLHQVFIGGWGQSIVELLDLDTLAETMHKLHRSTFFLTIQNLNVPSGIASPPNALAIL